MGEGLDSNLDSFLLKNLDKIDIKSKNIRFLSPFEITFEKINNIKADVTENQIIIDKPNSEVIFEGGEDLKPIRKIPNSIGITKAITTLPLHNGEVCVPPMDLEEYKRTSIQELNDPNTTSTKTTPTKINVKEYMQNKGVSAERILDMEEASWPELTKLGTNVHSIFEDIFNDKIPTNKGLPDNVFSDLVLQIKEFKKDLESKYPGCTFYPELAIKSKNLSEDVKAILNGAGLDSFNGVIDLLVIDKYGKGHIYDYKVSRKNITPEGEDVLKWWQITGNKIIQDEKLWVSSKKLAASYQTEMYRNMVEQYDIPVIDTNILPVKLNLKYENENNPYEITGVESIKVKFHAGEYIKDPGKLNAGNVAQTVSTYFNKSKEITSDDILKIGKAIDSFFPKNSVLARGEDLRTKVEYYKTQDYYVHKLKPGEPKYKEGKEIYRLSFFGQPKIYCEKDTVDSKIQELIGQQNNLQTNKRLDVARAISSIIRGEDISTLTALFNDSSKNFVEETFRPYLQGDWTFQEDEGANSIGLFKFVKGHKSAIL